MESLDWVRGWMLVASVGVNSLLVTPAWFDHAEWEGVNPLDLIFPVFVTLSGCGLAFALHRRVDPRPFARRVLVLLAAGLLYNAVVGDTWDLGTWRVTGVLQMYAVVVVVLALGHLLTRTWRGWALLTALLAAAHTLLLSAWARNCPGGELTRECNPSGVLDPAVFGAAHVYAGGAAGHDPEGLVAVFGAVLSASAGAVVGHLLLERRARDSARPDGDRRGPVAAALPVLGLAVGLVALGLVVAQVPAWAGGEAVPAMKRLWTAPFALVVAGGVAVALLAAHLLLDRAGTGPGLRRASWPLIALGRNSLLVYFGSHVVSAVLRRPPADGGPSRAERWADAVAVGDARQLTWTLVVIGAWVALACLLHWRRIYLRP